MAFDINRKEGDQYSDKLLNLMEQFENCGARIDREFSPSERKVIHRYIEMMAKYKHDPSNQFLQIFPKSEA